MAMTGTTIIRRSLTARLFSTVTTIITVAVAVALMLVLLSMGESSQRAFQRGSGNMHLLVSNDTNRLVSVLNAIFYAGAPARPITWAKYQEVERLVRGRLPVETNEYVVPIQQGDSYRGFPVTATTVDFFERYSPDPEYIPPSEGEPRTWGWNLREGRFLRDTSAGNRDGLSRYFDVVIGAEVARRTGLRIGDEIHLTHGRQDSPGAHVHDEWSWEVVGVLEPTGSAHDRALFTTLESAWLIHAQDELERESTGRVTFDSLAPEQKEITGILLRTPTRPGRMSSPATGPIAYELARDPALMIAEPRTEIETLFEIVSDIDDILLGMAIVVLVSSGIAIMLALYNSMEQRRRQIAVLRVLGASRWRIFLLVLGESAVIGVLGAIAGIVLSIAAAQIVALILEKRLGIVVEPSRDPLIVALVAAGTILLAAIAGVIPASLAYRTAVARNLRPMG